LSQQQDPAQPLSAGQAPGQVPGVAAYRSFLFADLRGYTSFIERAGNAAGVELLDDYLQIVRKCVSAHEGAEIKVEGDGFHAVFPSASAAVMCGLEITAAAAEASAARPDRPMNVGIGIHAGEAVETADGFIGSAVNIASRVCAAAPAGEVLVTSTVRGITHASIAVTFIPRGRRRLKGIADPVELFAVAGPGKEVARRRGPTLPRWAYGLAGVAGAIALLLLGAYMVGVFGWPAASVPPTGAPTPAITAPPLVFGALEIGEHQAREFQPPFSLQVGETGWTAYRVQSDAVGLTRDEVPTGNLDIGKIRGLLTEPCNPEGPAVSAGETPEDLIDAIKGLLYVDAEPEKELTVGDYEGKSISFVVNSGAMAACGGFGPGDVGIFKIGTENWSASPGEFVTLRAIDVNGETVSMLLSGSDPSGSVQSNQAFFDRADQIVQSLEF
jgi:class 3 adenylate cyclase